MNKVNYYVSYTFFMNGQYHFSNTVVEIDRTLKSKGFLAIELEQKIRKMESVKSAVIINFWKI